MTEKILETKEDITTRLNYFKDALGVKKTSETDEGKEHGSKGK